jgi:hypothetical protein
MSSNKENTIVPIIELKYLHIYLNVDAYNETVNQCFFKKILSNPLKIFWETYDTLTTNEW